MIVQPSGYFVPGVSEAEASGEIADIYADIRDTLGMSFVNLIWRNLATIPGGLRWVWQTMKPLYHHGGIYGEAEALRDAQELPMVPRLTGSTLRAVGVDDGNQASIYAILDGYDRGNPLNIIAFCALMARLDGHISTGTPPTQTEISPALTAISAISPIIATQTTMLTFEQMPKDTASLVHLVNHIGVKDETKSVQVSLPRNLAHWPGFLSLYYLALTPLHDNGTLMRAIDAVIADGYRRGTMLSGALGATKLPKEETMAKIRHSLNMLIPGAMGRMIPVVTLLKRLMPETE